MSPRMRATSRFELLDLGLSDPNRRAGKLSLGVYWSYTLIALSSVHRDRTSRERCSHPPLIPLCPAICCLKHTKAIAILQTTSPEDWCARQPTLLGFISVSRPGRRSGLVGTPSPEQPLAYTLRARAHPVLGVASDRLWTLPLPCPGRSTVWWPCELSE